MQQKFLKYEIFLLYSGTSQHIIILEIFTKKRYQKKNPKTKATARLMENSTKFDNFFQIWYNIIVAFKGGNKFYYEK